MKFRQKADTIIIKVKGNFSGTVYRSEHEQSCDLQGTVITETVLSGITIIMSSSCKFSIVYIIHMPKFMKVGWQ